jgi:hypothetical protein
MWNERSSKKEFQLEIIRRGKSEVNRGEIIDCFDTFL